MRPVGTIGIPTEASGQFQPSADPLLAEVRAPRRYVGEVSRYDSRSSSLICEDMSPQNCVYILESGTSGKYYIGSTSDPSKRLEQHNNGKTPSTKNRGPWQFKLIQWYPDAKTARRVEYRLKMMKRKDLIRRMIEEGNISLH